MTTYSIIIEIDGKLCGKNCPWLSRKKDPQWGRECRLFNMSMWSEPPVRCYRCPETVRRLKRMKP